MSRCCASIMMKLGKFVDNTFDFPISTTCISVFQGWSNKEQRIGGRDYQRHS